MHDAHKSTGGDLENRLRDITGRDELAVERVDSFAAVGLLDVLMGGARARQLTAFERDRLLARLHASCFGGRIESTLTCEHCGQPFDISFDLEELSHRICSPGGTPPEADGTYLTSAGVRFRLPTGDDETSVAHLSGQEAVAELLRRCVIEAPGEFDRDAVQDEMERVAPILDIDLDTSCPECNARSRVRFDLQSYFLQSILQERSRLWREVHILASTYRWGLDEILNVRRADRQTLASLIEADRYTRAG